MTIGEYKIGIIASVYYNTVSNEISRAFLGHTMKQKIYRYPIRQYLDMNFSTACL